MNHTQWYAGGEGLQSGVPGKAWERVGPAAFPVNALLRGEEGLYAGSANGLWKIDTASGKWKQLHDETLTEVTSVVFNPARASENRDEELSLLAGTPYGVAAPFRDEAGCLRWQIVSSSRKTVSERYTHGIFPVDTVSGGGGPVCLVGTEAGVVRLHLEGGGWERTSLRNRSVTDIARFRGYFWAVTEEHGVWRSEDGIFWEQAGVGLDRTSCYSVTADGAALLVGTSRGVFAGDGWLDWDRISPSFHALTVITTRETKKSAKNGGPALYCAGGGPAGLWYSPDQGGTWRQQPAVRPVNVLLPPREDIEV